jgi:hypothetical protein
MKITPTSLTISQLLGAENEQYVIPAYQRRYSWKQHQVEDMWDDLAILEGADSHLFGTIVCLAGHHTAGVNQLELVDGQQRLTTISIFLHCLLDRLKTENQGDDARDLARVLSAKAQGGASQPKILLDSLDAKQFARHAAGDLAEPVDNPRLLQAFDLLRTRLAALSLERVGALLYRLKNQAVIIRLDVSEAKDAFKLFETINNRGLRLSSTDIIKNFILGNAARFGEKALNLAKERWAEVLTELDGIALDTFFRQYMMAHLAKRVTKAEVVDEFQKTFMREVEEADSLPERSHYADHSATDNADDLDDAVVDDDDPVSENGDEEDDESRALPVARMSFATFLNRLVTRARVYRQLVLATTDVAKLDRRLRNLRLIRAQPSYSFLMALRASGCNDKTFGEVLQLTETFLVRRHTTRERTNENETVFAQLCSADPVNPMPEVRARYKEYCPNDERFRQEFVLATFPSRLLDRARYCLEQFELASQGTHPELLPGGPDIVHIEHIIPQKIKTKRAKKQLGDWVAYLGKDAVTQHPRYVSRIGNLTLFAGDLNISASNNPYRRKKAAHAQSAFALTKSLPVKYPEFRFKQVESRSQVLADLALTIWPAI